MQYKIVNTRTADENLVELALHDPKAFKKAQSLIEELKEISPFPRNVYLSSNHFLSKNVKK